MRMIIAEDGVFSPTGHIYLEKGSLWWESDDRIPLVVAFNYKEPPIAMISDIRREDDGKSISGEIKFDPKGSERFLDLFNSKDFKDLYDLNLYATDLVKADNWPIDDIPQVQTFSRARLRAISLTAKSYIPKGLI